MIYICRRTGLFGPRHLIATQSFTLHWKKKTSIHEKMGFEIQVIDMSISPSPQGAKLEIQFEEASLL